MDIDPRNQRSVGLIGLTPSQDKTRSDRARLDSLERSVRRQQPPLVGILPEAPLGATEVNFQTSAMAAQNVIWKMRYRSSPNRWEFVGGAHLRFAQTGADGAVAPSGTAFIPWPGGPSGTVPATGVYQISFGFNGMITGTTNYPGSARAVACQGSAGVTNYAAAVSPTNSPYDGAVFASAQRSDIAALTAGSTMSLYVARAVPDNLGGTALFAQGWLWLRPVSLAA